jgi:hypothetical protein
MSRLVQPLSYRTLQSTGDTVVHAELVLEIKTNKDMWEPMTFVVDSGTEMTTLAASQAKARDLPIPRRPVRGLTLRGQEVRSGLLRARIVGMDATEYLFPCYFLGDPDVPRTRSINLLGLTGVINQIRFAFDGESSTTAPFGVLVVEKK